MTMPECIRVADGGAAASRATVHSTPPLSAHRRRLAWFPTPGLGSASGIYALASPARWSASTTRSVRAQHSRGASSTASRPNRRCPKPRWCDDVGFDATAGAPGAPITGGPGADDQRTQRPSLAPPLAPASQPDEKPRLSDWVGVLAMCTGLVMAIMDVQIVTSSLTQIQGGLSASSDEIACSNLGPALGRSGACFVNLGSPLRQALVCRNGHSFDLAHPTIPNRGAKRKIAAAPG